MENTERKNIPVKEETSAEPAEKTVKNLERINHFLTFGCFM